jgi:outer membrane protein assembly factor BamB
MHSNDRRCHGVGRMLALALACASVTAVAQPNDRWPMYQANAEHTGYLARTLLAAQVMPLWNVAAQATAASGLAISDGYVFTTPTTYFASNAPLVAQSLSDGHVAWAVNFGAVFSVNQPAIDHGVVYLQTSASNFGTYLHAFTVDGTFLWRAPFDSQFEHYLGPIVVDGTVYFNGGTYGGLYRFDASIGTQTWYRPLPQTDMWCPTWNHGVIVAYTDRMDVIAPDSAVPINIIYDNDQVQGIGPGQAAVVIGNLAYVSNGGRLVAYDLLNGRVAWALAIGAAGQVATDGDELFVIANGALTARAPSDGSLHWSWTSPSSAGLSSNLIVTDSHLIAGDSLGTYLVNRTTHQADAALPASGMLAYGADTLVVADTGGRVHAYRVPTESLFADGFD